MKINCKITNSNRDFCDVILRKFYQVIFLNDDKQSFDIYTGIITSGKKDPNGNNYVSSKFELKMDININGVKIKEGGIGSEDFINTVTQEFSSNPHPIRTVWGKSSALVVGRDDFRKYYKQLTGKDISLDGVDEMPHSFFIDDPDKNDINIKSLAFILNLGENNVTKNPNGCSYLIKSNDNIFNDSNHEYLHGYELFTWVKTTFLLDEKITDGDNSIEYIFDFDKQPGCTYTIHDFTLYFVMPKKYEIDIPEISFNAMKEGKICFDDHKDSLLPKTMNELAFFKEWKEKRIMIKKYYKLNLPKNIDIGSHDNYSVKFRIVTKIEGVLSDFTKGVLLSFFLAFGIDETRLAKVSSMFPLNKYIPADFTWIILCFFILMLLLIKPYETRTVKRGRFLKIFSSIILTVWFIFTFVLYKNNPDIWTISEILNGISQVLPFVPIVFVLFQVSCLFIWRKQYDFSFLDYITDAIRRHSRKR